MNEFNWNSGNNWVFFEAINPLQSIFFFFSSKHSLREHVCRVVVRKLIFKNESEKKFKSKKKAQRFWIEKDLEDAVKEFNSTPDVTELGLANKYGFDESTLQARLR